jgi:hypothetical protein
MRTDGVPETTSLTRVKDIKLPDPTLGPRTLIIVSSTIDFASTARLLQHVHANDRLVFIGKPLEFLGTRLPLLPVLMSDDSISRGEYSEDGYQKNHSINEPADLDALLTGNWDQIAYDAKRSARPGIFAVTVENSKFVHAAAGLCHQLSKLGTVSIVVHPQLDKQDYLHLLDDLSDPNLSPDSSEITVEGAEAIERGDSDSSVVVLAGPLDANIMWIKTAIATSRTRVVVVGSNQSNASNRNAAREMVFSPADLLAAMCFVNRKWNEATR